MNALALRRLADVMSSYRILVSRSFGVLFFAIVLTMESLHEGSLVSTALFLVGLFLVAIATVGRLWCSLYISGYKDSQLITTGPYSICRNPLYFFSFLGFAGIGFATETFTLGITLGVLFLLGYPAVVKREEEVLHARFGADFEAYCARTPRFIPNIARFNETETYLVNPRLFRRTMRGCGLVRLVRRHHRVRRGAPRVPLLRAAHPPAVRDVPEP